LKNYLISIFLCLFFYNSECQPSFDIVITGGRVMDPETSLDEIKNVGIKDDRIVEISSKSLKGTLEIDATGLVVSPGFIDLHVHGMTNKAHIYQARDGVTTALELEGGISFLREWIDFKTGNSIVNFGATVPHGQIRAKAMEAYNHYFTRSFEIINEEGFDSPNLDKIRINLGRSGYQQLTDSEITLMKEMIKEELQSGALGIGAPVGYYTGAGYDEIFSVYELAANFNVPIFSHTRNIGMSGIHEAISNATTSGAPLHIVHANSLSLGDIQVTLDMVASAQDRGLDVTTEIYPYTAASTTLESQIFDGDWKDILKIDYSDIQWEATGERLTEKTFYEYRKEGGIVIIHMMKPEWLLKGIKDERTIIGSDGMPYAPGAHPRTAGTFSRVLGRYVREQKVIDLMTALKKMTILPAQRLEEIAPAMHQKGRLQVGADADITIFDPKTIIDRADFKGLQFSEGVEYVLINGELVVSDGKNVENVFPGRAVMGKYRR